MTNRKGISQGKQSQIKMSQIYKFNRYAYEFAYKKCAELPQAEQDVFVSDDEGQRMRAFMKFINKIFKQDDLIDDFYKYVVETYGEVSPADRDELVSNIADLEDEDDDEEEKEDEVEETINQLVNKYAVLHLDDGGLDDAFEYVYQSICFN